MTLSHSTLEDLQHASWIYIFPQTVWTCAKLSIRSFKLLKSRSLLLADSMARAFLGNRTSAVRVSRTTERQADETAILSKAQPCIRLEKTALQECDVLWAILSGGNRNEHFPYSVCSLCEDDWQQLQLTSLHQGLEEFTRFIVSHIPIQKQFGADLHTVRSQILLPGKSGCITSSLKPVNATG